MPSFQSQFVILLFVLLSSVSVSVLAFTISKTAPTTTTSVLQQISQQSKLHRSFTTTNVLCQHHQQQHRSQLQRQQQCYSIAAGCPRHITPSTTTSPTRLYMGWGPDPIWTSSTITSISDACPSGKSIFLEISVPKETYTSYTIPGQYVQVKPSSSAVGTDEDTIKPAFLAMCSGPSSSSSSSAVADENDVSSSTTTFRFLIKRTSNNEWLTESTVGSTLDVSQVLGNGYNIIENIDGLKYDFPTQNILLFAVGSGIAPIAAAIVSQQLQTIPLSRSCRLYYGERTANDLCFVDQFSTWEQLGVEVVPVLSQPDDDWKGRSGYIQTALEEDGIAIPRNTAALLCGMKGMTESVKELLLSAGVFDGRVLFNF